MKQRADKFNFIADYEDRKTIQGEAQKYKDEVDKIKDVKEKANATLNVYAWVSFDEGYRKALKELRDTADEYIKGNVKIKKRKFKEFHYATSEDMKNLF